MEIKERLHISKILIDEFERLSSEVDTYDDKIDEIIRRACMIKLKMQRYYFNYGEPMELLEQIDQMDSVIKKLEEMQNKYRR